MTDRIGASSQDAQWEEVQRRLQAASIGASANVAPVDFDHGSIKEAPRTYDPSMLASPIGAAAPSRLASAPDPLPPAVDAYHGIHLRCLAGELPPMTRTDAKSAFTVGPYRMQPSVRVHEDGSASVLYWTAVNKDAKRGEFIVGPRDLETFKTHVDEYARAGATAYAGGEPNEWQRQSLKVVDDSMRKGPYAGIRTLTSAWAEAVKDPNFWGQTVLNTVTAFAGAGAASKVEAELEEEAPKRLPEGPGQHSPTVEGGLGAHEGGPPNGHTLEKHVGKTEAELRARLEEPQIGKNGKPGKPPSSSSAFYDRATAEANISNTMTAHEQAIKDWLADPQGPKRLKIEYHPNEPAFPVGRLVVKGEPMIDVAGTRTVLVKDATTPSGFRILTAFPIE